MRNKIAALVLACAPAWAQIPPQGVSGRIQLPADSPLTLISADWSESRTTERGSALVVDLHTSLSLRNSGQRRVRGLTVLVSSQEVTPGGRASVTRTSLDIGPGETLPLRIDLRLLRPMARGGVPAVEVTLDGVLFDDLSFYGPNRLDSRRLLAAWETEARRDRRWMKHVLEAQGPEGLRKEALASLARQAEMPRLDVRMARGARTTASDPAHEAALAFLQFPDAPVEALAGTARLSPGLVEMPRIDVVNRSQRAVKSLEVGWLVNDGRGREYLAGAVPAPFAAAPGSKARLLEDVTLRFEEPGGQTVPIGSMTAFVSQVEFADGAVWVPSRAALNDSRLRKALAPSAEEQRLTTIYRKRGLAALVDELKKF